MQLPNNTLTRRQTSGDLDVAFDIETNGIDSTEIHCMVLQDLNNGIVESFNDQTLTNSVVNGVCTLNICTNIVSHNGVMFDVPQIQKHFPFFNCNPTHWDTLILSRYFYSDLMDIDLRRRWPMMPAKLYGSHSLEAYGFRLNLHKGDYGKTSDWKDWTPEMEDYCKQDVAIVAKLWTHFRKKLLLASD